ncbi:sporulation peptidase YabG [Acetivibrio cellulolyticus]|uniref:sporulation peptidase YabG n=1 Tax=Acetivibrio cellulolyticus TaxID=35830 RepID=UPI0001E2C2E6|nr:sporulation peptidase YabG [Acetivibrio cellulolyticus]
MYDYKVGDIVTRKSHGEDIYFTIIDIVNGGIKPVYVLRGVFYRIEADSSGDDLIKQDYKNVQMNLQRDIFNARRNTYRRGFSNRLFWLNRYRDRPGKVLQMDSSEKFLNICKNHYREAGINIIGIVAAESEQPGLVSRALKDHRPDILVLTGHDGIKKEGSNLNSIENYRNSKYFIQSVKLAREYESSYDRLCIFAGACQSYFEGIMNAGANFASSPGRININALDPAIVSEKVALTDESRYVTPQEVAVMTISGVEGIGGIRTRGHLKRL